VTQQPISHVFFSQLPSDPKERLTVLVDLFGEHLFAQRNMALRATTLGVRNGRADRATLFRQEYEEVARLPPEGQAAALALARKAIDTFLQNMLSMLGTDLSTDLRLGPNHAVTYEIVQQIRDLNDQDHAIVEQHVISHGAGKFLADYYGRWLNRFDESRVK
jgi:hypothetical protein